MEIKNDVVVKGVDSQDALIFRYSRIDSNERGYGPSIDLDVLDKAERVRIINERRAERKKEIIMARLLFRATIGELAKRHNLTPKTVRRILTQGGVE